MTEPTTIRKLIDQENIEELSPLITSDVNKKYSYPVGCKFSSYYGEDNVVGGFYHFHDNELSVMNDNFVYFNDWKSPFGHDISWTMLQLAAALGKQKLIDFLLENGANSSIKDSTGRTAMDIAKLLNRKVTFKKPIQLFFLSPIEFFSEIAHDDVKLNKKIFESLKEMFEKYTKGKVEIRVLDEIFMKKLKEIKHPEVVKLMESGHTRGNFKNEFIQKLFTAKERNYDNSPIECYIQDLANKEETFPILLDEKDILMKVFEKLFVEWKNENSKYMEDLDSIVEFQQLVDRNLGFDILKRIKNGQIKNIVFSEIFPDVVEFFNSCGEYFNICDGKQMNSMKLYLYLHTKRLESERRIIMEMEKKFENERKEMEKQHRQELDELKLKLQEYGYDSDTTEAFYVGE